MQDSLRRTYILPFPISWGEPREGDGGHPSLGTGHSPLLFLFAAFPPVVLPREISRDGALGALLEPHPGKFPGEGGQAGGSVGRGCLAWRTRSRYPVAAQGLRLIFPH